MVEDRVTDAKRVAQLLASELTGLETGPLAAVDVTDADPGADPSPGGTVAYRVTVEGAVVGAVVMYPDRVVVDLGEDGLTVESGTAVKRAVDAVREYAGDAADG